MMQMALEKKAPQWRKALVSAVMTAALSALLLFVLVPLFESGALRFAGASERNAAIVGLVYALFALFIGVGVASPGIGAQYLNTEDADELRDQRRMMALSAAASGTIGAALIILALAGPGGIVPRPTALAAALALFAASIPLTLVQWRYMDELMRKLTAEATILAYYLVLLVGGGWAMLAHLDYARAPSPIDWLTMFFAFTLAASFIATGRRGMLKPR